MKRCSLLLCLLLLAALPAVAQKVAPPEPELERVVLALPLSKRSSARMLLARAGGTGRKVILDALSGAGAVPAKGGPAKEWPEKDLLSRLKTAMPDDRYGTFAGMLKATTKEKRELLLEMVRLRIDLPKK